MAARINILGRRFGRLVVVSDAGSPVWRCACDCGGVKFAKGKDLLSGKPRSCGCLLRELVVARNTTHGLSRKEAGAYRSWKDMRARCTNPNDSDYPDYGGRGIRCASDWDSFAAFFADMGPRPVAKSLDRIDVNGDYTRDNCRWADATEQANNKRNNRLIERDGVTRTLSEWCRMAGLDRTKVSYRLAQGWPHEKAFADQDFRR